MPNEQPQAPMTAECPECGCKEYVNKNLLGEGSRECVQCGQEWWTDIDYNEDNIIFKYMAEAMCTPGINKVGKNCKMTFEEAILAMNKYAAHEVARAVAEKDVRILELEKSHAEQRGTIERSIEAYQQAKQEIERFKAKDEAAEKMFAALGNWQTFDSRIHSSVVASDYHMCGRSALSAWNAAKEGGVND